MSLSLNKTARNNLASSKDRLMQKNLLRAAILIEHRYTEQAQPRGLSVALGELGHDVEIIDAEAAAHAMGNTAWLHDIEIVVARGRSWPLLALLAWAEACGVPTLNSRSAIGAVHNKAEMTLALLRGNVPTPLTYFGRPKHLASRIPYNLYPLLLKPIYSENSQGLRLVACAEELRSMTWTDDLALAQKYIPNDGFDLKLYVIGSKMWAVREPSPLFGAADGEASLIPLTPKLEDLGRRCGEIFTLHLYSVNCIVTPTGPIVIGVNDFPNYSAIPNADQHLAEFVCQYARIMQNNSQ